MEEVLSTIATFVVVSAAFTVGVFAGNNGGYKAGAIAVTKGELMCKEVEQLSKPAEWQCVEVKGE